MDVEEAIRNRYSVRAYQDRQVEKEKLQAVLESARLAPSGNNRQPWRFVVVLDGQRRLALAAACNAQQFVAQAPVVIAAVGTTPQRMMSCAVPGDPVDVAIAIDHMTLTATALGLGTCWIGSFDQQAVRRVLNIPESVKVIEVLTLGYPADSRRLKARKQLEEIVCWEKWDA